MAETDTLNHFGKEVSETVESLVDAVTSFTSAVPDLSAFQQSLNTLAQTAQIATDALAGIPTVQGTPAETPAKKPEKAAEPTGGIGDILSKFLGNKLGDIGGTLTKSLGKLEIPGLKEGVGGIVKELQNSLTGLLKGGGKDIAGTLTKGVSGGGGGFGGVFNTITGGGGAAGGAAEGAAAAGGAEAAGGAAAAAGGAGLAAAAGPVGIAIVAAMKLKELAEVPGKVVENFKQITEYGGKLAGSFLSIFGISENVTGAFTKVLSAGLDVVKSFVDLPSKFLSITSLLSGDIFKDITKSIQELGKAVLEATLDIVKSSAEWVKALSPNVMYMFGQAVKDLQATLGTAFVGMWVQFTSFARFLAGALMPVLEGLRPIIDSVTDAFLNGLRPVVRLVATVFEALLPIFRMAQTLFEAFMSVVGLVSTFLTAFAQGIGFLMGLFEVLFTPVKMLIEVFTAVTEGISTVMTVWNAIAKTVQQTVMTFIQSFVTSWKPVIDFIKDAFKNVATGLLVVVANIAKFFGANDFLRRLEENLRPRAGARAALEGVSTKGIEQIAADISQAAAGASPGAAGREDTTLADLADVVRSVREGNDAGAGMIVEVLQQIRGIMERISRAQEMYDRARKSVQGAFQGAQNAAQNPFGTILNYITGR